MNLCIYTSDFADIHWKDEFMIYSRFKESDKDFSTAEYISMLNLIREIIGEKHFVSLVDIRVPYFTMDKEAQQIAANDPWLNKFRLAEAVITDSLAFKISLNFYLKVFKPYSNTKVFSVEKEAINWLTGIWEKHIKNENNHLSA